MAEALARRAAQERGLDITFASAGTGAALGSPATDGAILVGLERGVDLSRHRSRPLLPNCITRDTVILVMSESHVSGVRSVAPKSRVFLLDDYGSYGASSRNVVDPYGGELTDYRVAADTIEEMLEPVLARVVSELATGTR